MANAIATMRFWFELYYGDCFFLLLAIISYMYLFLAKKDLRGRFLLPIAMILFCIVNPVLYIVIFEETVYWRLFWMFPDAIIIACAMTSFIKRWKSDWMKLILVVVATAAIIINGKNMFVHGNFEIVKNWVKLSEATVSVCDTIKAMDSDPKVLFPRSLYSEVRQYAPEIDMMYGRNADGFISWCPPECLLTIWHMNHKEPDYNFVFKQAGRSKCDFVVLEEASAIQPEIPLQHQYEEVSRVDGYVIYYKSE